MVTIRDFKGRLYNLLETTAAYTLLESVIDGSRIKIRSYGWDAIGFIRP